MNSYFSAEFFTRNREQLLTLFPGTAPIVIPANGLLQRNADNPFPYRQDSNFWYLTGVDLPDALLVIDKGNEYLILPDQSPNDLVFGAPYDFEAIQARSGIQRIESAKDGWRFLSKRLKRTRHVATLAAAPSYLDHYGFYTNPSRADLLQKMQELQPNIKVLDLRAHMARMRTVKRPEELKAIRRAVDITVATLKTISRGLPKYQYEYEIEADITRGFRKRGAEGHAFMPVVAAGSNTCHLHYTHNKDPLTGTKLLYLDVGAEVEHYSADITRTFLMEGAGKRERAVLDAVNEVAAFARDNLRIGKSIKDNEVDVEQFMGEKLRELGLIKTIDHDSVRKYYPHACSHYLGLDTHDIGDYERPLEANMVLTVEPGIYIPEEGIGVRVEDDVLMTIKGLQVLSRKLPRGE